MWVLAVSPILVRSRPRPQIACGRTTQNTNRQERARSGSSRARGSAAATGWRRWDRDARKVEVELHSTADEEGAGQELAVLAVSQCHVERRQSNEDDRCDEIGKHQSLPPLCLPPAINSIY